MSRNINFLQDRQRIVTTQQVQDKKVLQMAGILLGGIISVFVIVLAIQLGLRYAFNQVKAELERTQRTIAANEDVEESVLVANQKLKILALLFDKRHDKQKAIDYFTTAFGPEVVLGEINYEAASSILSLSVKADSIFQLENMFTILASDDVRQVFGDVSRSELRRTDDGIYSVTLTVALGEDAKSTQDAAKPPESEETTNE